MTDEQVREYLRDNGYPEHVVRGGRAGLLQRWRDFVADVERGYRLGLEDYRNELDYRAILRDLGLDPEVSACDERLRALLVSTERRVWESAPADPWWDFGYPRNAGSSLLADLEAEGLR